MHFVSRHRDVLAGLAPILLLTAVGTVEWPAPPISDDAWPRSLPIGWGFSTEFDAIINMALYLPFGIVLGRRAVQFGCSALAGALSVLVIAFCVSYLIETWQVWLPARHPAFHDVLSNSAGALVGFWCTAAWQTAPLRAISNMATCLGFVVVTAGMIQQTTSLRNWDTAYPLVAGNEATGSRPWIGTLSELWISDVAWTPEAVAAASLDRDVPPVAASLLAAYDFSGRAPFEDRSGASPALAWVRSPDREEPGAHVGGGNWLHTMTPPDHLTGRIASRHQFTVGTAITSAVVDQGGPARIVSLSADADSRNLTIAQQGEDLVVRVRTPLTGTNGTLAPLIVPEVFATRQTQQVTITYDGVRLTGYVDGQPRAQLTYAPAVAVTLRICGPSSRCSAVVYWCLLLAVPGVPCAAFAARSLFAMPDRSRTLRGLACCAALIAPGLIWTLRFPQWGLTQTPFVCLIIGLVVAWCLAAKIPKQSFQD